MALKLNLNGTTHEVDAEPGTPLLWVIRDELKLTGTKFGCGVASCGACTVHVNGEPVRSCQTFIEDVEDAEVTTIEAVGDDKIGAAVQQAWVELDVVQCGYCQSGQVMSAVGLLSENPKPSVQEIDEYMSGNACRCATYQRIRAGIQRASEILEA
ncbi:MULTISPECIES: (2Fe-2S)-binding protein [Ruegeria]|jgi:isoquinoline 1-oxidoreductase alpha subunit|uniref:2Fe-2S iron-sulfur cluster binding domain-containing protein n=1 Tax=Ruegeria atlantica TaxID=81569 RepID=A0AA90YYW8_9RHOB|nr:MULTISPECIES: (2Fe-2S)-binding protein [Ruegeria]MCA0905069.1 (2Fe-2S)-binding protein [Ruegeria marisrubri]NOC83862.1 2Fe-2S iron-sulfur cluster binding domain-containing protein [Ruegeria sp. HKCCD6428]NOC91115.1 2Fe-2S iron-sulfur cluster binding domain-containing protein [Ruegeria sp. HKCCD6604]NOD95679.1 2Fe-2S iron-sulfur cluster binding domain-containing protein [Ruegeria sp. HKCCD6228]NOE16597.1 2Fe-2S iron-sulfur cluster binding domain-containing protein [Ruegeria atlantica]